MKAMDSSSLRIGAWRVEPALDQISKDGSTVKLERRAMQLLLCLAEHAGQVVSVEQLLDEVWAGVVVTPDSVYHAVAALRRILGDDTKEPTYIANVPRRGYRLVAPVTPSQAPAVEPTTVTVANDKSIAVLPFLDMSERKDQEYFADGIAEGIRDLLAKIPAIKVIGRSSSCQFKGKNEDLREIGSKLGVAYVLEGSVRKSSGRVRVTAQLIDVRDGSHRWSESYDRDLIDVLKVQDEISIGLVRGLQLSMGADQPGSRPTLKSVEGYNLYLRGRLAFNRYDKQGYDQAASYFRQAMELDPDSALASAWLAYVYWTQAAYGFVQPGTAFEEARRYAERALSLSIHDRNSQ
jgi:TolB-like protein